MWSCSAASGPRNGWRPPSAAAPHAAAPAASELIHGTCAPINFDVWRPGLPWRRFPAGRPGGEVHRPFSSMRLSLTPCRRCSPRPPPFHPALSQAGDVDHARRAGASSQRRLQFRIRTTCRSTAFPPRGTKTTVSIIFLAASPGRRHFPRRYRRYRRPQCRSWLGLSGDLLITFAAGADDFPDLIGVNLHGEHLGAYWLTSGRGGSSGGHDLVQNGLPGVAGDVQSLMMMAWERSFLISIWMAVIPSLVPATLKSISPVEVLHALDVDEGGEGPRRRRPGSGRRRCRPPGALMAHPASMRARVEPQMALGGGAVGEATSETTPDGVGGSSPGITGPRNPFRQGTVAPFRAVDLRAPRASHPRDRRGSCSGAYSVFPLPPRWCQLLAGGRVFQVATDRTWVCPARGPSRGPGGSTPTSAARTDLVLLAAIHGAPGGAEL